MSMSRNPTLNMLHWRLAPLACIFALLETTPMFAQSGLRTTGAAASEPPASVLTREADGRIIVHAKRITQPIRVDGRLDDAAYHDVPPVTEFIQQEPHEGAPTTEKTEAWVMFDDRNLYITCRCWDEHPERIVANDMRRDSSNLGQHDQFAVGLDTFHDGRTGVQFSVTAAGGVRDGTISDERLSTDWNPVFESQTSRFDRGWIVEMAIPFKSLRYKPGREQTWGIQLRRQIHGQTERTFITPVSAAWGIQGLSHFSAAATLVGLETPPAALNLEVKPYAISRVTTDLLSRPAVRNDVHPDAGLDVKYGLTKGLTTDVTYNTDFAQVEADEAQINLTRFSLVFPEKREFFLEGQGIFHFGGGGGSGGAGGGTDVSGGDAPTVFYSRRIGLSGARVVPVIVGGRLTGKAGPWNVGALTMETDQDGAAGAAQTNFTVLRVQRDILGRSAVGGIFTRRSVSTLAPGANDAWGLDANFGFYQNVYFNGYLAQSRTSGRRDDDLSYHAQFNYAADRYGLALDRLLVGQNFNPEVGFLRRENFRRNFAQARFSPRTINNRLVRKWTYQGHLEYITNNENRLESRELGGEFVTAFHSSDTVSVEYLRIFEFLRVPFPIAEGVRISVGGYSFDNAIASFRAGQQHRVSGTTSFEIGSFYGGDKKTASFKGRVEITPQLGVEPNISLNWIDLPEGRFTTTLVGQRATFTMTPRMFVAALVQYSSSTASLSTNLRFRWEYRPGSELFVVYTEGRSTFPPRGTELQNRGFVVKINRLFRF